ncbi:MAG: hypothetical protein AAGH19_12390 [Pseudomonadota bacterium]
MPDAQSQGETLGKKRGKTTALLIPAPFKTVRLVAVLLCLLLMTTLAAAQSDSARYKWVDDAGHTYFKPIPPEDPNQPYCMRRSDGPWTCYEGADRLDAPPPDPDIMNEAERQKRYDQLLTSRFRSLDDIDRGREERLAQLEFERKAVESNLASQKRVLFSQIRAAADRQRAGLTVTEQQLADLALTRTSLRNNEAVIARLDRQSAEITREHEVMKDRYRELLQTQSAP